MYFVLFLCVLISFLEPIICFKNQIRLKALTDLNVNDSLNETRTKLISISQDVFLWTTFKAVFFVTTRVTTDCSIHGQLLKSSSGRTSKSRDLSPNSLSFLSARLSIVCALHGRFDWRKITSTMWPLMKLGSCSRKYYFSLSCSLSF